jgi:hypothetical protein
MLALQEYTKRSTQQYVKAFIVEHQKGSWADEFLLANIYRRNIQNRANVFLCFLYLSLIGLLYLDLLAVVIGLICATFIFALLLSSYSTSISEQLKNKTQSAVAALSAPVFLSVFGFIIIDFIYTVDQPVLIAAILGLIATRQLIGAITQTISNVGWFSSSKARIHSLFNRGYLLSEEQTPTQTEVWSQLLPQNLKHTIHNLFFSVDLPCASLIESKWLESYEPGIYMLLVTVRGGELGDEQRYVVKFFEKNRAGLAKKEEILHPLLFDAGLSPKIIRHATFRGYRTHILTIESAYEVELENPKQLETIKTMLSLDLQQNFLDEYIGTHPLIWDRVDQSLCDRLRILNSEEALGQVSQLGARLPDVIKIVRGVPLSICIPHPAVAGAVCMDGNNIRLLNIGDWKLEPLGAAFPVNNFFLDKWRQALSEIEKDRSDTTLEQAAMLCASLANFERAVKRGNLLEALCLSKALLEHYDIIFKREGYSAVEDKLSSVV